MIDLSADPRAPYAVAVMDRAAWTGQPRLNDSTAPQPGTCLRTFWADTGYLMLLGVKKN